MNIFNIDIFVISLKRSKDRQDLFDKNNSKYITNYTYHNAVDGNLLLINNLDSNIFTKGSQKYSNGAIGCALSHLQLWEKCIELNRPILIMEDDAIVNHDFMNHLNTVKNILPDDWDILQLTYNYDSALSYNITEFEKCNCYFSQNKLTKSHILKFVDSKINTTIAKLNNSFGTSAYMISPKGAKILKTKCFPLNNTIITVPFLGEIMSHSIDCMMNTIYKDISAYVCIIPFIITPHVNFEEYKSTIV